MDNRFLTAVKTKAANTKTKVLMGMTAATAPVLGSLGYCAEPDVNATTNKVVAAIFNIMMIGGLAMLAVGIAMLVRTIIAMSQGDQAQPGALGKAVAFVIGGVVLMAMKSVLKALGVPVDNFKLFG